MKQQTLDQRLESYGVTVEGKHTSSCKLFFAASAVAGMGAVIIPPPAEAAIVYSGTQSTDVKSSVSVKVDFNGDGQAEFTFNHFYYSSNSTNSQLAFRPSGSVSFMGTGYLPDRLGEGVLIDDNGIVTSSVAVLAVKVGTDTDSYGNFLGNSGYLGVKFELDSTTHYGWIQFEANNVASVGTIVDWAYEDTPDKAIKAGAKKDFNWNLFLPAIISGNRNK